MHNRQKHTQQLAFTGLELLLLFLIFVGAATQVLFGQSHSLFLLLRAIYIPGLVFLAGSYAAQGFGNTVFLVKRAGIYAILFIFFGLLNQVLLNHKKPFQSLIRLVTLTRIPTPSEIFFTAAVLFLCAALAAKYYKQLTRRKGLLVFISMAALWMVFFPSHIFGYPIIGVFTGCETYDCTALLPYCGYFVLGLLNRASSEKISSKKKGGAKRLVTCAAVTFLSAILTVTPLKPVALVTAAAFPVYILYLISSRSHLYQQLVKLTIGLYDKVISIWKKLYDDFLNSRRKARPLYFIVYTGMFLIMTACVFFSFIEYDNSIIWNHDAISQYIPRIHYFIEHIRSCISQALRGDFHFPSYSFRNGLGNAVTLSYEPVYWLFVLFPPSKVEAAYNIITLLRFFLAGLSASIFFLYHKRGYFESLLGSMLYTFCGFAIYAGVLHAHFIAPMIFLPLLMIATEEVFRKKRWYLCTLLVAVALPANYYFIYMSTIAMGIYYIGRFLFTKDPAKKTWKYFFTTTATFAGAYLLGVIIGNISLFTSFASYMSSGRTKSSEITAMSFFYYNKTWLTKLYTYFISAPANPGSWLKLGFVPLSYIAIVMLLMKKGNKLLKFLFFTCAAFCVFPVAAFVLSGFSVTTNRWSYILALLVSYITVRSFPEFQTLTKKELKILFVALLPYLFIILMNRDYRTESTLASLAVLLCNYVVILCMNQEIRIINKRTAQAALMVLCCGALTLNAYYQYLSGKNTSEGFFVKQGAAMDELTDTPLKVFNNYPDKSFYRVSTAEIPRKILCSSLVMNYNSISTFSSTISAPVIDYNVQMGNTAWNLVQLGGFDNRTFMNALACVKYYALSDTETARLPYGFQKIDTKAESSQSYHIYKNDYALPLGYTYDHVLSEEDFNSYNALEKQEILLQSAVLDDSSGTLLSSEKPLSTLKEIPITSYVADGINIKGDQVEIEREQATLTLYFDGAKDSETYLVFDGKLNPTESNGKCIVEATLTCDDYKRNCAIRSTNHTYGTRQDTFAFNMGYRRDAATKCTLTFNNTGTFTYDSLKVYCQPMADYASYIDALTEDTLENITIDSGSITGNISVDKEKLLVFSIPYQKGWTAYVDGKETELKKANLMYSAVVLEPGDHDIRLVFHRPGMRASLCLSAVGMAIFIIALIIRRRRIKINK